MPVVGLLTSLGGMYGIITTISQAVGGWWADRIGLKPFILAGSFFLISGYACLIVAGLSITWLWLFLGIALIGFSWISRPATTAMVAESAKPERHGTMFSLIMFAWIVPGIVAPSVGGWLTEKWGYTGVFPVLIFFEAVAFLLTWKYLAAAKTLRERVSMTAFGKALLRSLVPQKGLEWFYIAVALDGFSWAAGWGLINGLLKDAQHFSVSQLGMMASVMSLAWAIVQMPIGRYLDNHRAKMLLIVSEAMGIPIMVMTMLRPSFLVMMALQILYAIVAATWVPAINTFITRAVNPSERSESFGRINMFRGLIAFPAPWIGGLLFAKWGFHAPLMATLIGIFVVLAIMIFFVRESERITP